MYPLRARNQLEYYKPGRPKLRGWRLTLGSGAHFALLFLVLGVLLVSASTAWSGWRTFTPADGLASNTVRAILEDHNGNLWFGTGGGPGSSYGVSRFDGSRWTTFTTANGRFLDGVSSILEDRSGNLWFATDEGVFRFDGSTWRIFTTADGLASNHIRSMLEDQSGNLWFGTGDCGVTRYDGSAWRTFTRGDGLWANSVYSILQDRSGTLWFGSDGGVSRYNGAIWTTTTIPYGDGVRSMLEDDEGNIWFGTGDAFSMTRGSVYRFDGFDWESFYGLGYVTSMVKDRSGNLWVGTMHGDELRGKGVSRFDGRTWKTFTTADGLGGNQVNSMTVDRSGNVWFGTAGGGVSRFDGSSWETLAAAPGNTYINNSVAIMHEDLSGNLWFATYTSASPFISPIPMGVSRYDPSTSAWKTFTSDSGLIGNQVSAIFVDRSGNLWFTDAYYRVGVTRYDGVDWTRFPGVAGPMMEDRSGSLWFAGPGAGRFDSRSGTWTTFTSDSGLASNNVRCMLEDASGGLWFGTDAGVSRYDREASSWKTFTSDSGLASNHVSSILEDRSGNLWFGTDDGLSRYDRTASAWRTFRLDDVPPGNFFFSMLVDQRGDLWLRPLFAAGVRRFDGSSWTRFFPGTVVQSMLQDRSGNLWFGTQDGAVRYDGATWRTFSTVDGLANNWVYSMLEDRSGNLWFATNLPVQFNVSRYAPDRIPPNTNFLAAPPGLTSTRSQTAAFAAFGEAQRIEFSYRFDSADSLAWSSWSAVNNWSAADLPDGIHVLEVRARDFLGNTDATPAKAVFEIDATPPSPQITSPAFAQAVRGVARIIGTAVDARFKSFRVDARPTGLASWNPPDATLLSQSSSPVTNDTLAQWDTTALPDGNYDLRLAVTDSLGLVGVALVTAVVDNHAPYVDVTSPARVPAASGGEVFTTNGGAHLYFAPHSFVGDAVVTIGQLDSTSVPDRLPSGALGARNGYHISWSGVTLEKQARLDLSYRGGELPSGTPAVFVSGDGMAWRRLGGTWEKDERRLTLAISEPGRYAIFTESGDVAGESRLSEIAFTPRVFSPSGTFADRQVGISFTLGRPAPVSVRVYSRSGRLIREIADAEPMNAGANMIRWDGRDRNGGIVTDGLYLVTVEALGQTERKALAVVR